MGAFEARKNNWSFLTDVIYVDLGVDSTADLSIPIGPIQVPVTTSTNLDLPIWVLHFAGGYELYSADNSRLDLIGGVRYLDLGMDLFLELESLGPGQSRTISETLSAWDGIIGLKGQASLGEQWFLPYCVDVGAGESELTWIRPAYSETSISAGRLWASFFAGKETGETDQLSGGRRT